MGNAMCRVEDKLSFGARAGPADLGDDLAQFANYDASIEKLKPRRVTHPVQHFALDCQESRSFGVVKAEDRSGGAGEVYPVLPERYGRRGIEKVVVGAECAVGNMDTGFETTQPITLDIVACGEYRLLGNGSMDDTGLVDEPQAVCNPPDVSPEHASPRARQEAAFARPRPMRRTRDRIAGIKHDDRDFVRVFGDIDHLDQDLARQFRGQNAADPSLGPRDDTHQVIVEGGLRLGEQAKEIPLAVLDPDGGAKVRTPAVRSTAK